MDDFTQAQVDQLRGELYDLLGGGDESPLRVYTGVDLAVQRHAKADSTVLFTIGVHAKDRSRHVLNIESGKWAGPEIVGRIISTHDRFGSVVVVENNAAQDFILQFTREVSAVPIIPFTTGRNKAHPEFGVESLFAELANGKWVIPNIGGQLESSQMHEEVQAWLQEMLYYEPGEHTGDRLMAAWLAREGARRQEREVRSRHVNIRVFGDSKKAS